MSSPTNRPSSPPFPVCGARHGNPSLPPTPPPYRPLPSASCHSVPCMPAAMRPAFCRHCNIAGRSSPGPMWWQPCHPAPPTRQPDPSCPERPGLPATDAKATSKGKRSGTATGGAGSGGFPDRTAPARTPPFCDMSPSCPPDEPIPPPVRVPNSVRFSPTTRKAPDRVAARARLPAPLRSLAGKLPPEGGVSCRCLPTDLAGSRRREWSLR